MSETSGGNGAGGHSPASRKRDKDFLVVSLGGSAGALSAFKVFFRHVPPQSGMAYVIILHLSPEYESCLAEVLQQATEMPVEQVTESVRIEPDRVYVIPPNKSLSMRDGMLTLSDVEARDLIERQELEDALRRAHDEMEERVRVRTAEFQELTGKLWDEVNERGAAEHQVRELLRRLVTIQENERRRIARELHDQLGQQMTALRLKLESFNVSGGVDGELLERVRQAQALAAEIDSNVDFLAWEMRPASLDELGVEAALENFVREWSKQFGVEAAFHSSGFERVRLQPEVETNLYRILQEALQNVHKHARANRVDVLLERRGDAAVLIVEDNGQGYDPEREAAAGSNKGMGVINMRERTTLVGGTLEIESTPGGGTTIFVRVPFKAEPPAPRAEEEAQP